MTPTEHTSKQIPPPELDCSIIIPTRDQLNYLKPCIDSILASQCDCVFEILIVDNGSRERITKSYLESLLADARIRLLPWPQPFNFSELNNFAAHRARGDVLCFLNNDTKVITPGWLDKLVAIARRQDVGAAGALLLYPDNSIQHGGIALDRDWVGRHIAHGERESYFSDTTPDNLYAVDAVSAACMFTRRDLFLSFNGFNADDLAVSFNDVDYCLRLQEAELPVVMSPRVKLYHYESVSRKSDDLPENQPRAAAEKQYMLQKWQARLKKRCYFRGLPKPILFLQSDDNQQYSDSDLSDFLQQVIPVMTDDSASQDTDTGSIPGQLASQKYVASWEEKFRDLEIEYWSLANRYREVESTLHSIIRSPLWRLSAPLRFILRKLVAMKRWCGRMLMHFSLGRKLIAMKNSANDATTDSADTQTSGSKSIHDAKAVEILQQFLESQTNLEFPSLDKPLLSIILVFYNKAALSYLCLKSIRQYAGTRYQLIVVDNASSDETPELLQCLQNVTVIRNTENLGFVKAVNQAADAARGQYLLLLNNDAELEPAAVDNALRTIQNDSGIGAVGGKITLLDGSLQEAGSIIWNDGSCLGYGRHEEPMDPQFMFRRPVDYCSGAFLLIDRQVFDELGGFDEAFAPAYYEESDFCIRLWKSGRSVIYEPESVIRHYEFASSGGFEGAARLQAEHRKILCEKHADFLATRLPHDEANILYARTNNNYPNILIIDDCVPHPELGAGYPRCADILQELSTLSVNVTFYPLQNSFDEWQRAYSTVPVNVELMLYLGREGLPEFLEQRKGFYQYIVVSRVHNMEFFRKMIDSHPMLIGDTKIIYDAEAVTAPREVMRLRLKGESISDDKAARMINDEITLASNASRIITVSRAEAALYEEQGLNNTSVLGHQTIITPTPATFEERKDFLFVGALRDEKSPNVDSVVWFVREVLPLLNKALDTPFSIIVVGDNTAPILGKLRSEQVKFLGRLSDLDNLYNRCRVFIAPTRFAAGIPRKIHEAAAFGLPVVATSLLARQLGWQDQSELLVADSAEEYAQCCVRLYTDPKLWSTIRANALDGIVRDCSPETFSRQVAEIFTGAGGKSA